MDIKDVIIGLESIFKMYLNGLQDITMDRWQPAAVAHPIADSNDHG
jgi:hypothetical protein